MKSVINKATIGLLMGVVSWSYATIWHVPGNFGRIQDAFNSDSVQSGDTIQVHPGTYYENINFNGKNVLLHGGDDINIPDPDHVIIDANYQGTGVKFVNGEGPDAIIRGFTIQHGKGTLIGQYLYGGGILIFSVANQ